MKKIFTIALVLLLIVNLSLSYAELDYSSFSEAELYEMINKARNEILYRMGQSENDGNTFESDGIIITFSDTVSNTKTLGKAKIDCTIINYSKKPVSLSLDELYVNGWSISAKNMICDSLVPGRKAIGSIDFDLDKAGARTIDDVDDVELSINITDSSDALRNILSGIKIIFEHIDRWQLKNAMEIITSTVYWVTSIGNKVYHTHVDCQELSMEDELVAGTVEQAIYANHSKLCYYCAERDGLTNKVPTANP